VHRQRRHDCHGSSHARASRAASAAIWLRLWREATMATVTHSGCQPL